MQTTGFPTEQAATDFLLCGAIYALEKDRFWVGWEPRDRTTKSEPLYRLFSSDFFFAEMDYANWIPRGQAIVERTALLDLLETFQRSRADCGRSLGETRDAFVEQFASLQTLIASGIISKGVPYGQRQMSDAVGQAWIARRLYRALQNEAPAFAYGMWDERQGLIGCGPERLAEYSASSGILKTEAVAGTSAIADYSAGDLLRDPKAIREHAFVVEDLTERLSSLGVAEIGQTYECKVPGLVHLKTPLHVCVPPERVSLLRIIQHLHPTAALGVYPRNAAGRAWLEKADRQLPRWKFGAPFGISRMSRGAETDASDDFSCLVAIRNVQWRGNDIRISAGCGVIESSEVESEWQECLAKIQSIRNLLDL